ncbi:MAG: WbqC family protein [Clostridium botulinum]|uniref:WbqC family protein n=1 Tax=Clostridium sporogenes TaxID=1509 RepID=UPI0013CFA475|nr:WbqC family protein [Clostridium sporogenes]MDU1323245.1 WbqC family protein [Clostridium botulinum]NFP91611.1 WbqC family protein [Clostridium sporogenes]
MRVGIMQPYIFPYLGYFQLINAVEKFVIHDDIQFIKGGWINRNSILFNGDRFKFVFSVKKDHYYKNINERYYTENFNKESKKFLANIVMVYKKAPYFDDVYKLLENILNNSERNVAILNTFSIVEICKYIGINNKILFSSKLNKDNELKSEERVIDINKCLNSHLYINPIGGTELYSKESFQKENIKLNFIKMKDIKYKQFNSNFLDNLSIIDVMMFNDKITIKKFLEHYELV